MILRHADAVRDSVANSLKGLREEKLIQRIAGSVVAQLGAPPRPQAQAEKWYAPDDEK
jgi:hypothetical protein